MPESIPQFYQRIRRNEPNMGAGYCSAVPYFNMFSRKCNFGTVQFSYREFYKITLILGRGKLYYADKWILVDRPALMFSNPLVPYAWESINEEQKGIFCIFNEAFVVPDDKRGALASSPLFNVNGDKVFFLDDKHLSFTEEIFRHMQDEISSGYANRLDAVHCYIRLLSHLALKMHASNSYESHPNAAQRIVELFLELLDRQFPANCPHNPLTLRTPSDYASRLSIHVNHLNKVVKETTGKTTSAIIAERIIKECTQYLLHSSMAVSEIAYSMGFESPAYFSKFYRSHTGKSPMETRKLQLFDSAK